MTDPKPSNVLNSIEVDAVIGVLMYHATPDVRRAVMAHCPVAYAKLAGLDPQRVLGIVAGNLQAAESKHAADV